MTLIEVMQKMLVAPIIILCEESTIEHRWRCENDSDNHRCKSYESFYRRIYELSDDVHSYKNVIPSLIRIANGMGKMPIIEVIFPNHIPDINPIDLIEYGHVLIRKDNGVLVPVGNYKIELPRNFDVEQFIKLADDHRPLSVLVEDMTTASLIANYTAFHDIVVFEYSLDDLDVDHTYKILTYNLAMLSSHNIKTVVVVTGPKDSRMSKLLSISNLCLPTETNFELFKKM